MNFIPMRKLLPIFLLYIIGLSLVSATYTWTGTVNKGTLQVNDITLNVTKTLSNTTIVLIQRDGQLLDILRPNETKSIENLTLALIDNNGTLILSIASEEFFAVTPYRAENPAESEENLAEEWSFTWSGIILVNQTIYLDNNMSLTLLEGPLLKIEAGEIYYLDSGNATINNVYISIHPLSRSAELFLASNSQFGVTFKPIIVEKLVNNTIIVNQTNETTLKELQALKAELAEKNKTIANLTAQIEELKKENNALKTENTKLKQRVSELEKQLKSQPNTAELQTKLVNLTKENRELKASLKNMTEKYNSLKAKADFLEQQNEEYRTMIQNLLKETAQGSEQDYIEQAKKERLIGSVLLKSIIFATAIVGLIGYGLYRIKRRHEFAGL